MTSDFKDQFKRLRDDVRLLESERVAIREAVLSGVSNNERPAPSPFVVLFAGMPMRAGAFALLLVAVFTGTSLAAEGALPGEVLYSMKVSVNERIERVAALGTVAKAEVDVEHAEERIREVELLAAKGKEDTRDVEHIAQVVDSHLLRASESAKELMKKGNDEDADRVADRISSALLAHADILEAQAENEEDEDRRKLRALSVRLSVAAQQRVPEKDATDARTQEYYERIAFSRGEEAKERVEALKEVLSENKMPEETRNALFEEQLQLEGELADTQTLLEEGEMRDAAEAYAQIGERAYLAYALAISAERIAEETDKEVIVSLGDDEEPDFEMEAGAATLMLSTELATTVEEEASLKRDDSDEPKLKFIIRDREED